MAEVQITPYTQNARVRLQELAVEMHDHLREFQDTLFETQKETINAIENLYIKNVSNQKWQAGLHGIIAIAAGAAGGTLALGVGGKADLAASVISLVTKGGEPLTTFQSAKKTGIDGQLQGAQHKQSITDELKREMSQTADRLVQNAKDIQDSWHRLFRGA